MLIFLLLSIFFQDQTPSKHAREFEITTKYELRKKPVSDQPKIVFDPQQKPERESGTDMLPYLIINLKVKKWAPDVEQVRVVDGNGKQFMKKKQSDEGLYTWDMGYVDDIKDKVTSGKFTVQFIRDKKPAEQIIVQVEEDGTFLVNGEKRGKF
jgi:hypothetical protein